MGRCNNVSSRAAALQRASVTAAGSCSTRGREEGERHGHLVGRASRAVLTGRGKKMVATAINLGEAAALRLARVDRR
jgi:hypothetical protein